MPTVGAHIGFRRPGVIFEPLRRLGDSCETAPMRFLHRAVRVRILAAMAATAVATPAAPSANPEPEPEPAFYFCQVTRSGPFGGISYGIDVPVDGSPRFHRINWQIPRRTEGLRLSVQWTGFAPVNERLGDRAWVLVHFQTTRRIRDDVRIEIRRTPGDRYASEFAYAGPFRRPYPSPDRSFYSIETQGRWGELNAWMSGRDALTFALVQRDGTVMAEDRLDAATLAGADIAIAEVRPEVEAMAADYRHRCEVPEPIIVTARPESGSLHPAG